VEQKQREKQTPDNNNNYQPPINDAKFPSSNEKNLPVNSDNSSSQTDNHDKRERERERERERTNPPVEPPTTKQAE
jgi:hypothetical protein